MGVSVRIVQAAADTVGATQDFTVSGFGTPKAALFFWSYATTNGSAATHCQIGLGMTDGTREFAMQSTCDDAVGTTETNRKYLATCCILGVDPSTAATVDMQASFNSWITDGIRVDWDNNPANAQMITCILFGGSDLSVHVGTLTTSGSVDGTVDVTAPGFEPDQLVTANLYDIVGGHAAVSWGFVDNGAGVVQASANFLSRDARPSATIGAEQSAVYCGVLAWPGSNFIDLEVGDFDANGFTVTTRNSTTGSVEPMIYLALNYGGVAEHWAGTISTPTSTGTQAFTGPGFTPQFAMLGQTFCATSGVRETDGDAGAIGIGAFTATEEYSASIQDEDGASTSNTQSMADSKACNMPRDDGTTTDSFVAVFSSMDAGAGFTLNFTTTDTGAARQWAAMAIEEVAVGGNAMPMAQDHYYRRRSV